MKPVADFLLTDILSMRLLYFCFYFLQSISTINILCFPQIETYNLVIHGWK